MWENREFRIRLKENTFQDYERVILTSGECDFFMPMGFMSEDRGETICYDCSGFTPLSRYRIERTEDVLYILERTLIIVGKSVEYLITPSKIKLDTDTVFYNSDTGEVKIAYVPMDGEMVGLRKNLLGFLLQLKSDICDKYVSYVDKTAKYIYYQNYQIKDVINKIGLFKREIYDQKKYGVKTNQMN